MKKSTYFYELAKSYSCEVDDLFSDSEGKSVLQKRLQDKRGAFKEILPMIEMAPEMVAVAFYDAFVFNDETLMSKVVLSEPDLPGCPSWTAISKTITVAPWAAPLIKLATNETSGDSFMVATAALEFLRTKDRDGAAGAPSREDDEEEENQERGDEDDENAEDLAEMGAEWMSKQGFDSLGS